MQKKSIMSNKFVFSIALIIAAALISINIFHKNIETPQRVQTIGPDLMAKTNTLPGFTYLGMHELSIQTGNKEVGPLFFTDENISFAALIDIDRSKVIYKRGDNEAVG
jgi:hypothetical protein